LRGHVFGEPGMVVDTHVGRLSRRLGLTRYRDPGKVERDLCDLVPDAEWTAFSMRLILHGRAICLARTPRCAACESAPDCPRIGLSGPNPGRRAKPASGSTRGVIGTGGRRAKANNRHI
jgi:endonuclease-3